MVCKAVPWCARPCHGVLSLTHSAQGHGMVCKAVTWWARLRQRARTCPQCAHLCHRVQCHATVCKGCACGMQTCPTVFKAVPGRATSCPWCANLCHSVQDQASAQCCAQGDHTITSVCKAVPWHANMCHGVLPHAVLCQHVPRCCLPPVLPAQAGRQAVAALDAPLLY